MLNPLKSASPPVQQAFMAAVAAMQESQLNSRLKIPLLDWASAARVPLATIGAAACRAVKDAAAALHERQRARSMAEASKLAALAAAPAGSAEKSEYAAAEAAARRRERARVSIEAWLEVRGGGRGTEGERESVREVTSELHMCVIIPYLSSMSA